MLATLRVTDRLPALDPTTFSGTVAHGWVVLAVIAASMLAGTVVVLRRRSLVSDRR